MGRIRPNFTINMSEPKNSCLTPVSTMIPMVNFPILPQQMVLPALPQDLLRRPCCHNKLNSNYFELKIQ